MADQPLIAVTGATGAVGSRVATLLAAAGARQLLLARDPTRAPALAGAETRRIAGYGAADDVQTALGGADTLFLVPATEAPDRVAQHVTAIDAAVAAGVSRIVYLSFVGAAPDATFTFGRDHWATEEHIRATGLPWTFLRMSLYLDGLPMMAGADGVIRGPAGDGRVAAIARDDVASAAAAVLTTGGHDGRTYDLTGPEAVTLAEAAAQMATASGKPIRFEDETDDEALASRAIYDAADWEIRGWVSSYQAIRDGSLAAVDPAAATLIGQPPVTLAAFLAAHPTSLDHVTATA